MAGKAVDSPQSPAVWTEPEGVDPRGTLVVVPGRGEHAALYERFGRRLAADAYRVHVVDDPTRDPATAEAEIARLLAAPEAPGPHVLVGSDTGALFAAGLVAEGRVSVAALVLAGLPAGRTLLDTSSFASELDARTACSAHRKRLSGPGLRKGALAEPVPEGWDAGADLASVTVPVLGLHGTSDAVAPLTAARDRYAKAPSAELVAIAGGLHDVLNDQTHRTVAATVVQFLERLRLDPALPLIALPQRLDGETAT